VVLPQKGHLKPGMFCVGGDSHSPTGGALGTYMFGVGSTEMLGVVVTGQLWVRVPQTLLMRWNNRLKPGVTAKDMMLHMIGQFGMNGGQYQAVEFAGEAVKALSMQERMTMSNMSAEMGSQVGLIAPDEVTRDWLATTGAKDVQIEGWHTDEDADKQIHEFDAATLVPQVAAPHSPANTKATPAAQGMRPMVLAQTASESETPFAKARFCNRSMSQSQTMAAPTMPTVRVTRVKLPDRPRAESDKVATTWSA
jgi:3-isopropylmalate/(R)-2-methylmalate dehydratase large subunit